MDTDKDDFWRNPIDDPRTPDEEKMRNDALHAIQNLKKEQD